MNRDKQEVLEFGWFVFEWVRVYLDSMAASASMASGILRIILPIRTQTITDVYPCPPKLIEDFGSWRTCSPIQRAAPSNNFCLDCKAAEYGNPILASF